MINYRIYCSDGNDGYIAGTFGYVIDYLTDDDNKNTLIGGGCATKQKAKKEVSEKITMIESQYNMA